MRSLKPTRATSHITAISVDVSKEVSIKAETGQPVCRASDGRSPSVGSLAGAQHAQVASRHAVVQPRADALSDGVQQGLAGVGAEFAVIDCVRRLSRAWANANLLFIATVILELENAQDAELTLFLVEEPEAHLHPPAPGRSS